MILCLAGENPRWGYRRIQGEALKLGFQIAHISADKIVHRHQIPAALSEPNSYAERWIGTARRELLDARVP